MFTAETTRLDREQSSYWEKLRFEEATDIAERLSYAIDIEIDYQLRGEHLYALSDRSDRPFIQQTAEALRRGTYEYQGVNSFQAERLQHEHDEAIMADVFARGDIPENVFMKLSLVPDAVANGEATLNGYRRDILRSFVRMYYREGDRVTCRIISLDQKNEAGIKAVSELLGISVEGRSSEDILGDHSTIWKENPREYVDSMANIIKFSYDQAVYESTGERTHAGSKLPNALSAHDHVARNSSLLEEHTRSVQSLLHKNVPEEVRRDLLESVRKNTAAAISLVLRGEGVRSINDSAVSVEVAQNNYEGECPTKNGMNQAASTNPEKTFMSRNCPLCGKQNVLTTAEGERLIGDCGCWKDVCTGEQYVSTRKSAKDEKTSGTIEVLTQGVLSRKRSNLELARMVYGPQAQLKTRPVLGGAVTEVIDRETGEILLPAVEMLQSYATKK